MTTLTNAWMLAGVWGSGFLVGAVVASGRRRHCGISPPNGNCEPLPPAPDWRRSINHENINPPSGPPPLKFRRSGEGGPGPTTPKPDIIPQGQDPGPVRHISVGYQPLPWVQGPANPPPKEP